MKKTRLKRMRQLRKMMPPPPPFIPEGEQVQTPIYRYVNHVPVQSYNTIDALRTKMNSAIDDLRYSLVISDIKSEHEKVAEQYRLLKRHEMINVVRDARQDVLQHSYKILMAQIKSILSKMESSTLIDVHEAEPVISSLGGTKYHKPSCDVVKRIPKEKRVSFESEEEAEGHDYSPCKTCFPREDGVYYGSKEQNKVHVVSCPSLRNLGKDNLVTFESVKAAFDVGFAPCEFCMRHAKKKVETKVHTVKSHEEESMSTSAVRVEVLG